MITCGCIPMMFQLFSNAICRGSSASHKIFFFWLLSILFRSIQYLKLVKTKNPKEPRRLYLEISTSVCALLYFISI